MQTGTTRTTTDRMTAAGGTRTGPLLRFGVLLDIALSGPSAALTLLTAAWWGGWFGVPTAAAAGLGVFFALWTGICVLVLARALSRPVVRTLGILNLGYAAASVLAGIEGLWSLTGPGEVVLVLQTLAVTVIGAVQLAAARR